MIERTWAAGVTVKAARAARAITLCLSLGDDSVTARSPKASCRDAERQGAQQHHPEQIASSAATSGLLWPSATSAPPPAPPNRSGGSGGHGDAGPPRGKMFSVKVAAGAAAAATAWRCPASR